MKESFGSLGKGLAKQRKIYSARSAPSIVALRNKGERPGKRGDPRSGRPENKPFHKKCAAQNRRKGNRGEDSRLKPTRPAHTRGGKELTSSSTWKKEWGGVGGGKAWKAREGKRMSGRESTLIVKNERGSGGWAKRTGRKEIEKKSLQNEKETPTRVNKPEASWGRQTGEGRLLGGSLP